MVNSSPIIKTEKIWYMKCWHCNGWFNKEIMIDNFNDEILCETCFNKLDKNGCYGSVED